MTVHVINTADEFRSAVKNNKIVIVDCFSERCPPCKVMYPVFEKASNADANRDSIHFIKYEVDNIVEISKELKISYTPAFIAFKDGERVDDIVSSDPVALEAFINKLNE